uniref:Uncharacterized protein n=1 Tax=Anguilla anguilla TaxID=7936 RepID=A0A0E9TIF5_ANGAN
MQSEGENTKLQTENRNKDFTLQNRTKAGNKRPRRATLKKHKENTGNK